MRTIMLFLLLWCLISCDRLVEVFITEPIQERIRDSYTSPYQGTWICNYTGDEEGVFTLQVEKSGRIIKVQRTSGNFYEEGFGGFVGDQGGITQTYSGDSQFAIYGSLFNKRGTWKKGDKSGEWTAVKQ